MPWTPKQARYMFWAHPGIANREAAKYGKSLNTLLIDKLSEACQISPKPFINHDFDEFAGAWQPDPGFDEALKDFDRIDPDDWE